MSDSNQFDPPPYEGNLAPSSTSSLLDNGYETFANSVNKNLPDVHKNNNFPASNDNADVRGGESELRGTVGRNSFCKFIEMLKNIDPKVIDLIYWRNVKKTAPIFFGSFALLLSLALFSVLSVVAYLTLVTLTVTVSFRLYKNVMSAVQKSGEGNPFRKYLDVDISMSQDRTREVADGLLRQATCCLDGFRRLMLVDDVVDSIKFGLFLWVLTYIGSWFNGMTLIILGDVALFTLPKFYDVYKVEINRYLNLAKNKANEVFDMVSKKVPVMLGKKKSE